MDFEPVAQAAAAADASQQAAPPSSKQQPRGILKTPHKAVERRAAAQASLLSRMPGGPESPIELKVLVLGPAGAGKSSVIRAFCGEQYTHVYRHTAGLSTHTVLAATFHGRPVYVRFWEVSMELLVAAARAGQASSRQGAQRVRQGAGKAMAPEGLCMPPSQLDVLCSGVHGAVVVFDGRDGSGVPCPPHNYAAAASTGYDSQGLTTGSASGSGTGSTRGGSSTGPLGGLFGRGAVTSPSAGGNGGSGSRGAGGTAAQGITPPVPVTASAMTAGLRAVDTCRDILQAYLIAPHHAQDGSADGTAAGATRGHRGPQERWPLYLLVHKADVPALVVASNPQLTNPAPSSIGDDEDDEDGQDASDGGVGGGAGRKKRISRARSSSSLSSHTSGQSGASSASHASSRNGAVGRRGVLAPHMVPGSGYLPAPAPTLLANGQGSTTANAQGLDTAGARAGDDASGPSGQPNDSVPSSFVPAPTRGPVVPLSAILGARLALGLGPEDLQAYASSAGYRCWWWTSALPSLQWAAVSVASTHGRPAGLGLGRGSPRTAGTAADARSNSTDKDDKRLSDSKSSRSGWLAGAGEAGPGPGSSAPPTLPPLPTLPASVTVPIGHASAGPGQQWYGVCEPPSGSSRARGSGPRSGGPAHTVTAYETYALSSSTPPSASLAPVLSALVDDCLEYWGYTQAYATRKAQDGTVLPPRLDFIRQPYVTTRMSEWAATGRPAQGQDEQDTQMAKEAVAFGAVDRTPVAAEDELGLM